MSVVRMPSHRRPFHGESQMLARPYLGAIVICMAMGIALPAAPLPCHGQQGSLTITGMTPPTAGNIMLEAVVSPVDDTELPIQELRHGDFSVTIDGGRTADVRVRNASANMAVILLVDPGRTKKKGGNPLQALCPAATAIIGELEASDPCSVVAYGTPLKEFGGFLTGKENLLAPVCQANAAGQKSDLQKILSDGLSKTGAGSSKRLSVILLTDHPDSGSRTKMDGSLSTFCETNDIPIYVVATGNRTVSRSLRQAVEKTGGRVFNAPVPEEIETVCETLMAQIRNQYVISVPIASLTSGTHKFSVRMKHAGLQLDASRNFKTSAILPGTAPAPPAAASAPQPQASVAPVQKPGQPVPPTRPSPKEKPVPAGDGPTIDLSNLLNLPKALAWINAAEGKIKDPSLRPFLFAAAASAILFPCLIRIVRKRRSMPVPRSCGWCAAPVDAKDALYCGKCAAETWAQNLADNDRKA